MNEPRVAFAVWNPFQVVQFQKLAEAFPNSRYLLLDGPGVIEQFDKADLVGHSPRFEILPKNRLLEIDGLYDILFFQAPFALIEKIRSTHLVSVQYGLAKERHNYGEWRALASMNLMYGPYSADFASHFAPSYAVGNVKFAGWDFNESKANRTAIESELGLDPTKRTILFMPTYGALGSFDDLVKPLAALLDKFNVIIKMHHNNEKKGKSWQDVAMSFGHRHLMSGDADQLQLLAVADVVVSDFSGAIFDALYAELPIVLYQARADEVIGVQKFSHASLEFRRRSEIGLVCENLDDFPEMIQSAIDNAENLVKAAAPIRAELFIDGREHDTIGIIREKVSALINGHIPALSTQQVYVRETCQNLRSAEIAIGKLKKKSIFQQATRRLRSLF